MELSRFEDSMKLPVLGTQVNKTGGDLLCENKLTIFDYPIIGFKPPALSRSASAKE